MPVTRKPLLVVEPITLEGIVDERTFLAAWFRSVSPTEALPETMQRKNRIVELEWN